MKNTDHKNSYLIYCRRSLDDNDNQKNSLPFQRMRNSEFAKQAQLPIAPLTIKGFCENGIISESHSAYQENDFEITESGSISYRVARPKFLQLIRLLKEKEIKGVIVLCWDRVSRNQNDSTVIQKLMKEGSDIRFADTTYDKGSAGSFHMDLDGAFAAHYSRVVGEKVRNAKKRLHSEGQCTQMSPIGYLDCGSNNKPFDLERAPIVKRIFEMYATGEWSYMQLAKWANQQGLTKKPSRRKRTEEERLNNLDKETLPKIARAVDHKTIEYILENPFYIGRMKSDEGYIPSRVHQPLVDTALFNRVQNMLRGRTQSVRYVDKIFFTYRGFIRCSCGRLYTGYTQKGSVYYRSNCKGGCDNPSNNLSESEISGFIQKIMSRISFTDEELVEIESQSKTELKKISEKRDAKLADLHTKQRNIVADIAYMTENRISLLRTKAMTPEAITDEETRLNGRLEVVNNEIRAYAESAPAMLKFIITFSELVKNASEYFKYALDNERRELTTQVFYEIVVKDKTVLSCRAKDGFEALLARERVIGAPGRNRTHIASSARMRPIH